jgi:hypothetical protein
MDANALSILSYTPSACHFLSVLQEVLYEPYYRGISIYLHPVVRTYSIPFKTTLSSALGLPTLDLGGRKGLITPHSKSLSSGKLIRHHTDSVQIRRYI